MVHKFKCRCFKMTPNLFLNIPTAEYKAQGTLRCVNGTYRCVNAISKIPEVRKRRLPSTTALIVNDATSGGGKVLSGARLEMAYCMKGSECAYLEDNYHIWQRWEGGRRMTVRATVRARARRWNVREIPFPKLDRKSTRTH